MVSTALKPLPPHVSIMWELVRNIDAQAQAQNYCIRICILVAYLGGTGGGEACVHRAVEIPPAEPEPLLNLQP